MNKKNPADAQTGKGAKIIKRSGIKKREPEKDFREIKISPARLAAFEILLKIERERSFSSILLPYYEDHLSPKDRGLCHELVLGVLRKKIFLDRIIEKFTRDKALDIEIITSLRLGIYQMIFLDKVPAYSAINESVNLAKRAGKRSASGLVNAVLRSVQRHGEFSFKFTGEIERISFETSHPRDLIEKWIAEFGIEEAEKIAAANNEIPRPAFRFTAKFYRRDEEAQKEVIEALSEDVSVSKIAVDAFVASKIDERLLELAQNGEVYFQDEVSQMVAGMIEVRSGEKFLDVCAAPGSKTTLISRRSEERREKDKNLIVAGDFYSHRIENLRNNLAHQAADLVEIVQYDAEKSLPFADESFDVILIDAPCSGTGTIRHNPEIRYFLREADFRELSGKQLAILKNASKLVTTGGKLIYSTCSLEIEENEAVIEQFLIEHTNFKKTAPPIAGEFLTADGFGRTFPHRDAADGFFVALLERVN